ncbi:hypothetical protein X566_11850 [Afipia sp. P52-10]|jgi:hypothetical protein|uniref:hypothetical protein n=1 Tax=Afipia sp. P52-10 TaxID=1429916 RepID=UPI0003DF3281|nr:hypothetical protein [Afipia sp. P52-10]ETR79082.1 hypothetical protein X566_11850 [Afipia sp. P52-10]
MRIFFYAAVSALIATSAIQTASAAPQSGRTDCHAAALANLQRLAPRGYAIYEAVSDKKQFLHWLTCDDVQLGLATGVHETVHLLTEERDGYPLIDGSVVRRPHEVSKFFAPKEIAGKFKPQDIYVQTYLRPGGASSKDDLLYLLDELNAYSHDLNAAVSLVSLRRRDRDVDHRDGLAAMMTFVMSYAETAQKSQASTWQRLLRPGPKHVVQTLWKQAEGVLASSCGIPAFGKNDRDYIRFLCEPKNGAALSEVLGRAPACASECLAAPTASAVPPG